MNTTENFLNERQKSDQQLAEDRVKRIQNVIQLYREGNRISYIAQKLQIPESTVRNIVRIYYPKA